MRSRDPSPFAASAQRLSVTEKCAGRVMSSARHTIAAKQPVQLGHVTPLICYPQYCCPQATSLDRTLRVTVVRLAGELFTLHFDGWDELGQAQAVISVVAPALQRRESRTGAAPRERRVRAPGADRDSATDRTAGLSACGR